MSSNSVTGQKGLQTAEYVIIAGFDQNDEEMTIVRVDSNGQVYITGQITLPNGQLVSTKNSLGANNPTSATVGITSATILNNNTSRKGLVLTNISTNTISIGIGTAALLYKGISLTPGGTWTMGEYTFYTGSIQAIASAASSELAIQEFV